MVELRSSCLVPISQLSPARRLMNIPSLRITRDTESFEILVSYRFEKEGDCLSLRSGTSRSIYKDDNNCALIPISIDEGPARRVTSEHVEETYESTQTRDSPTVRTPKNGTDTPGTIMENLHSPARGSTGRMNARDIATDSYTRSLRRRHNKDMTIANINLGEIQRGIVSKILRDADERQLVVTFMQDEDEDEENLDCTDVDEVNHEFEPIETLPPFHSVTDKTIGYILSRIGLEGNMFDIDFYEKPQTDKGDPRCEDIEAFNTEIRFNRLKEYVKKHDLLGDSDEDLFTRRRPRHRPEMKSTEKDAKKSESSAPEVEEPTSEPEKEPEKQVEKNTQDFSFIMRKKRALSERYYPVDKKRSSCQSTKESAYDTTAFVSKNNTSEGEMRIDHYRPDDSAHFRRVLPKVRHVNDMKKHRRDLSIIGASTIRSQSSSSYEPTSSQSRGDRSDSLNKEHTQTSQCTARRGILAEVRPSDDPTTGAMMPKLKTRPKDSVFGSGKDQGSDWSSEMWGSFINVIHSKRRTLGHGSFSTVSFAFLRLQPHLNLGNWPRNGSISRTQSKDSFSSRRSNTSELEPLGRSIQSTREGGNPTYSHGKCWDVTNPKGQLVTNSSDETEPDFLSQMLKVIDGYCTKCANVCTLDCAVKSINDVFKNARFQYIREKEMMLHFNSNVLKPLACRYFNEDSNKAYQLLMPKAQGDLLQMLRELIKYRTRKAKRVTVVSNHANGKREQKIIGLTEMEVKFLFFQVLSGLAFIQMCFQANIHRHSDIKLQNILVYCKEDNKFNPLGWRLCLADFGCSIMLHPTQHFGGACIFKNLQQSISKEWGAHLSAQLTSFVRGTVRCNAPEALSYDRHGNPRSNRNNNVLLAYKKCNLNMSCSPDYFSECPKVWSQPHIPDDIYRTEPSPAPEVAGASLNDEAEYFTVDMYSDMWSAGIILAELAKFGGSPESGEESNTVERISPEHLKRRINSTLGRGLFCRNTSAAKEYLQKDPQHTKRGVALPRKCESIDHVASPVLTDEDMNKLLAEDIANKCDWDALNRLRKLKKEYCWWEYPQFSSGFWSLLVNLLSYKPRERYLAAEALGHSWFDYSGSSGATIFPDLDKLMAEEIKHLPMEHFYYIGSSLPVHKSSMKSHPQSEATPFHVKREDLMRIENSDLALNSFGMYGKVGQTSNAWFSGPLHFRLMTLNDPAISLPEFVSNICRRETVVLEAREKDIFGRRGFILSQLVELKKRYMLSWSEMLSSRAVYLLGKSLISREYKAR